MSTELIFLKLTIYHKLVDTSATLTFRIICLQCQVRVLKYGLEYTSSRWTVDAEISNDPYILKAHSHQARLYVRRRTQTRVDVDMEHMLKSVRVHTKRVFTSVDGRKRAQNRARFDFERV